MDKLKQFINLHRETFDSEELPVGHELRFEKKLFRKRNPFRQYSLYALTTAACVAILIILILPFSDTRRMGKQSIECQTAIEINNLRLYYNMQMHEIIDQMEAINPGKNKAAQELLLEESARVMEASKQFEETVIPQLPCAQETIYAMSQHYNTSLQSLNFMLQQMEEKISN
ncbi:hypothetical protein [Parabacteroides pacaensis]|uniref:hypothetical protein n=1 Tax=Parabacteroides pacaensis TaxID=2086575 RepID=UPI00131CFDE4|nr:hypothetical protein [Parabacteroides pacaensis]